MDCGEYATEILEMFLVSGANIAIVDSVAALSPKGDIEKEALKARGVAGVANVVNRMILKILNTLTQKQPPTVLFVNQLRMSISTNSWMPSEEYKPGGKAQSFIASMSIKHEQGKKKEQVYDEKTGRLLKHVYYVTVDKNKVGPERAKTDISVNFDTENQMFGFIEDFQEIFDDVKRLTNNGHINTDIFEEHSIDGLAETLAENPRLYWKLQSLLYDNMKYLV